MAMVNALKNEEKHFQNEMVDKIKDTEEWATILLSGDSGPEDVLYILNGHNNLPEWRIRGIVSKANHGNWPLRLAPEAFQGLAGDFVRTVSPHSEADPAALLVQFLVAHGSFVGRGPYWVVEGSKHYCNLYVVLVGTTGTARKGTSLGRVKEVFRRIERVSFSPEDPSALWKLRTKSGLSSGEGLIWAVRDPRDDDRGESDKRVLTVEEEFASVLKVAKRETNILSPVIRQAWDEGNLQILTKNFPATATGAHISIIGHITEEELRRYLDSTEMANGFANRFLWVCVRRSNVLPFGGNLHIEDLDRIASKLKESVEFARKIEEVGMDEEARDIWKDVYPELSDGKPGLVGAVINRGVPQVRRLACIYALMDKSSVVRPEHLCAALAVWDHAEASVHYIFGDATGNPIADRIRRALRDSPDGLSRTNIQALLQKHCSARQIQNALSLLERNGLARMEMESTGGRPAELWFPG